MKEIAYGLKYMANHWLLARSNPLICGLVLHNTCNLNCRHCTIVDRPPETMSFPEAVRVMDKFYQEGGRCLYLEGGEPMIWRDNSHSMEDIVTYAHNKGYYAVIIYTNGTKPLVSAAETIFVSVDGLAPTHDKLRGRSFDKIMKNIAESGHPSLYINYTINSINKDDVEGFLEFTAKMPTIKGTFFYFHTPYYGYDELFLDRKKKSETLQLLLDLKGRYKILNSSAGLKSAIRNDWKKNLDICQVYEGGHYYTCCRESNNGKVCADCGYLSYAEIDQALKLKPGAVMNALKYF